MPDLHKKIAEKVRSKQERQEARQFLRKHYGEATQGTAWIALAHELDQEREPIDPDYPIEFYEVESRPVAVVWPPEGMGHAWVWQRQDSSWTYAPGLVNKSWLEGEQYGRDRFVRVWPTVKLQELEGLVADALSNAGKPLNR